MILGRIGEHRLARKICTCRPVRFGGFPCGKVWPCEFCAWVSAKQDRYERTARALIALEETPSLSFTFLTLTGIERNDWATAIDELHGWLRGLLRSRSGSWSQVRGLEYWIEPQRGRSGRCRPHLHAIAAFDARDAPRYPRAFVLKWASYVRARVNAARRRPAKHDRLYRSILRHCQIKPLRCYPDSLDPLPPNPAFHLESECDPIRLAFDLMNTAEYSRKDERFKHRELRDTLSAQDRVDLTLLGRSRNLRDCTGIFRGIPKPELNEVVEMLRQLEDPITT